MAKRSIILLNLGGPDRPESVQPFLNNLFNDPAIIGLPAILRLPLAKFIAAKRAPIAREIYEHLGGKSPLLPLTEEQAVALCTALTAQDPTHIYKVFIAMRYWHPFSEETVSAVQAFDPDEILLLPLYPQYSTATSASSFIDWEKSAAKVGLVKPTYTLCCYPVNENWAKAQSDLLRAQIVTLENKQKYRVLFSAHGLPKKIVNRGDPYQWQVERSAEAIAKVADLTEEAWAVCYQSRVGPLEWIGPSLDDELKRAAADDVAVIVLPIAFVSEHSETLVELDIEYRKIAEELGIVEYKRVPALGTHPDFICGLRDLSLIAFQNKIKFGPPEQTRLCPQEAAKCQCL